MNFHYKRPFYLFILFAGQLLSINPSAAQYRPTRSTQYTEKDGLPGVEVSDLLIDKQGYLWTGTVNGLARFDGYSFKRYYFNPNDTNTIHGLSVWSVFEDRKGQIWVGSGPSFLNMYSPVTQKFVQYKFTHLVPHRANIEIGVQTMAEDNNGRIYFGIDSYYFDSISSALLYKNINEDEIKRFSLPDSLQLLNIYRLKNDNRGNIWMFSLSGIFKIDTAGNLSRFRLLDKELFQKNDFPGDLNFDSRGNMWILSQGINLFRIDLSTSSFRSWNGSSFKSGEIGYWLRALTIDKNDNIFLGTLNGLKVFNSKTEQFENFKNGTDKKSDLRAIRDLKFDSFGTLWAGTSYDGLVKYEERSLLKSYSYNKDDKNSFTAGWANNIYEASDGKIWITTGGSNVTAGIDILDTRTNDLKSIPYHKIGDRINGVSAIWENKPGEPYVAVNNALYKGSEQTFKLQPVKLPGLPDPINILSYLKDSRQNEWLFTFSGVYKKEKGATGYRHYDLSKIKGGTLASNETTRGFESKKHGLWILTNNGLFLYDYNADKIERHVYDKQFGDITVTQDINSFYEGADGIAWIGTWQGGLSRYNVETKKIKTYTRNDGLPSMSIQGILADEKNNTLWLSTFEGLSRFNVESEQLNNFTIADGIQGQLFADGAATKTSDGLFIFGGANGITVFNPGDINKNSLPPKVFLTDLKVNNKSLISVEGSILEKPIYETENIELPYDQNNISIDFIALHFSNPTQNKYSYKLENYDDDWRNVGNQQVAYYPNLTPGEYIFRVKAANDKGVWNEKGATLKIVIHPPWWKTTGAYITYAILVILLGFAIDRFWRRRLMQREREKNRLRELAQAKEIERAYHKLEQTHEALKATQTQLIHSEKMASLGELTVGIAHEIQNPLNFVNNFSEINKELVDELQQELKDGKSDTAVSISNAIKDNSEKINHHGKRADSIVKGMLQHSRISSGQKEPTNINALVDEYLRLAYHGFRAMDKSLPPEVSGRQAGFTAVTKTDFDNNIGKIDVVPQDIGRVILNLINNAFYAVNEKQKQSLDGQLANGPGQGYQPTVTLSTTKQNGKVEIKIKDNGNGIPQKVMDKIFQPFFTTKPTGQGTGLGLSLAYDIVKAHGGDIKVQTKEGEGSEFIVTLSVV